MNDDIKRALGSAFADEPVLGIDRAELLRKGHTRLARRRLAVSSALGASVVAVVLGATIFNGVQNTGYGGEYVPPADTGTCKTSRTLQYSANRPTTGDHPPDSTESRTPPTTPACTPETAADLDAALRQLVPVDSMTLRGVPKAPGEPLRFFRYGPGFRAVGDLVDDQGVTGLKVDVTPRFMDAKPLTCEGAPECVERTIGGITAYISTERYENGKIAYRAISNRTDGLAISVESHNEANYASGDNPGKSENGGVPTRPEPVLTLDDVAKIATAPGLTF
jgi:hypothetical protein